MTPRLTASIDAFSDRWIPAALRQDPDVFRSAKRVVTYSATLLTWVGIFMLIFAALGSSLCSLLTLPAGLFMIGCLVALRCGRSPSFCGNLGCVGGWITITALGFANGGSAASPLLWYTVLPVVAVLTAGVMAGMAWTAVCAASVAGFCLAHQAGIEFPQLIAADRVQLLNAVVLAGLVICQFLLAAMRVGIEQRALAALRETNHNLANAQSYLNTLQSCYGFSMHEWTKLQAEKLALQRFINVRLGIDDARLADQLNSENDISADGSPAPNLSKSDDSKSPNRPRKRTRVRR